MGEHVVLQLLNAARVLRRAVTTFVPASINMFTHPLASRPIGGTSTPGGPSDFYSSSCCTSDDAPPLDAKAWSSLASVVALRNEAERTMRLRQTRCVFFATK